jgi:hypothetical protein
MTTTSVNESIQDLKVEDAVNQITTTAAAAAELGHGIHYLVIYDDMTTLREFYSFYAKKQIEENNDTVSINPFYETVESVRQILTQGHRPIDVKKFEDNQLLFINVSLKEYFGKEPVMESRKKIVREAVKRGKNGLSVIADVGAFYFKKELQTLLDLETSLPSHFIDMKYNGLCAYHQSDFDLLTEEQKQDLMNHHKRSIKLRAH